VIAHATLYHVKLPILAWVRWILTRNACGFAYSAPRTIQLDLLRTKAEKEKTKIGGKQNDGKEREEEKRYDERGEDIQEREAHGTKGRGGEKGEKKRKERQF